MHVVIIFLLFHSVEGKVLITVLQLRILIPKHLVMFLALVILDMIRSLRAGQPDAACQTSENCHAMFTADYSASEFLRLDEAGARIILDETRSYDTP